MLEASGPGSRFWEREEDSEGKVDALKRILNFSIVDTGIAGASVLKLVQVTEHLEITASS